MNNTMRQKAELIKRVIPRYARSVFLTGLTLFLAAGTFSYWQAWVFLAIFYIPMLFIIAYLVQCDSDLLKRRLKTQEIKPGQSFLANMFYITCYSVAIISGLDRRCYWSYVPLPIVILSEILFLAGYIFLFWVFKENKYLAHTVVIEKEQEAVTWGPYALVRHPMYFSELIMFIFACLALGSYWALIITTVMIGVLAARIVTEERLLMQELNGYQEYARKTKYRLIPGIW